jgi:hypothetical protein
MYLTDSQGSATRLAASPQRAEGAGEQGDRHRCQQGGREFRVELGGVDGQGRGQGEGADDQDCHRQGRAQAADGGPDQQGGQQPGHGRQGELGGQPAPQGGRGSEQDRQQGVMRAEVLAVGHGAALAVEREGVEGPVAAAGQLIGDVQVGVLGQADRGQQVVGLIAAEPRPGGRGHGGAGRAGQGDEQADQDHGAAKPPPCEAANLARLASWARCWRPGGWADR